MYSMLRLRFTIKSFNCRDQSVAIYSESLVWISASIDRVSETEIQLVSFAMSATDSTDTSEKLNPLSLSICFFPQKSEILYLYLLQTVLLSFHNIDRVFYDSFISLNCQFIVINSLYYFMNSFEMIVTSYESDNVIKPWIDIWLFEKTNQAVKVEYKSESIYYYFYQCVTISSY